MSKIALSEQQADAIKRFADKNGRTWKCKLISSWSNGTDDKLSDGALLRQIRNDFGPAWLQNFKIESLRIEMLSGSKA